MRLHRVRTGRTVAPWNDPVGETMVLGRTLRETQDLVAAQLGWRFGEDVDAPRNDDALYWDDDLYVSGPALKAWRKVAAPGARMALLEKPARVGDLEVEEPVDCDGPARLVGLRWGEGIRPVRVPPLGFDGTTSLAGPADVTIPWYATARTAVTVRHWAHLLRANVSALGVAIWEELILRPWAPLWAWMRSPLHPRYARIGRNCKIHPTARVEGCWLGDNVEIGAYTVARGCWIGDGASLEDHGTLRMSVIGRRAHVANFAIVNATVLNERASIGHPGAQACMIGKRSFVSTWTLIQDYNLRGNVKVSFNGKMVDTGIPFLGAAVGHDCQLGGGLIVSPGRAIPNGVRALADISPLARITGEEPPGNYVVRDGRLVPG